MTTKHALPELIEKRAGSAWRHTPPPHNAGAPTANRTNRTIAHDTLDDPQAHAQRLAALIGSRYNTRRPKDLGDLLNNYYHSPQIEAAKLDLIHAAQEARNRDLAHQTTAGKHLPRSRYYLPEQLAAHHATTPPDKLGKDYALQIAALLHNDHDLTTYLDALERRHNAPHLAGLARRTQDRYNSQLNQLIDELRQPKQLRHRLHNYRKRQTLRLTAAENATYYIAHQLARLIDEAPQNAKNDEKHRRNQRRKQRETQRHIAANKRPPNADLSDSWHSVVFEKPPREITHTGRLGRRRIATNAGKNPSRIHNYAGDPMRRIFTRNTRGTNALVIVDCSGSMSLTPDDLAAIMSASAGATVIGYSAGDSTNPNTYLLAHNGRRVRHMPDFNGNNGNDAPAASYAINNYHKTGAPILWITDGQATGKHDATSRDLRTECRKLAAKHGVTISPNVRQALDDLAQIRAGKRPPQRLRTFH